MRSLFPLAALICLTSPAMAKPAPAANPFFTPWQTPFGVPPFAQIKAEHFLPAFEEGMKRQKQEIDAIVKNPAQLKAGGLNTSGRRFGKSEFASHGAVQFIENRRTDQKQICFPDPALIGEPD